MTKVDYKELKNGGFMKQVQKDRFVLRLRIVGGHILAEKLKKVYDIAAKYGHKDRFASEKYARICKGIANKIQEVGNIYLKKQEISSLYVNFEEENDLNGYKLLDIKSGKRYRVFFTIR